MSIDNTPLPAFLIQSLFRNSLVDLKTDVTDITDHLLKEEPGITFLGGNEEKIIFLFNDKENKFLADSRVKFLSDLLTACQLSMGDIALVNFFNNNTITYRELIVQLRPKKILLFGISANDLDLPFTIPLFQMQNFQEQVYLVCPSIEDLQMNIDLKKQLWQSLQEIFNIRKQK
jgi:hypothetical protein